MSYHTYEKEHDSSSDEDSHSHNYPEPMLGVGYGSDSFQFVVPGTIFDVKIRESRVLHTIIGTCTFTRDEGKLRYAFFWASGMSSKYYEAFGGGYPTQRVIFNIAKKVALRNGFTTTEFKKCEGCK